LPGVENARVDAKSTQVPGVRLTKVRRGKLRRAKLRHPARRMVQIQIEQFFRDASETLVGRGFSQSRSAKIWFSKNLDIKILKTNALGRPDWDSPNCHRLDHDRAVQEWEQG